jgi:hypothetical protein
MPDDTMRGVIGYNEVLLSKQRMQENAHVRLCVQ